MKNFYYSLSEIKRIIFWIVLSDIVVFILSSFCFFIGRYDIPLGIIIGAIIALANYLVLNKQTIEYMKGKRTVAKSIFYYLIRFLLYGIGFALALVFEKFFFPLFEVFAVLGSYILSKVVLIVYELKKGAKNEKDTV